MRCGCGSEFRAVSLRATVACPSCDEGMSTGFACEAVRDLVCGACAGLISDEHEGEPERPHSGEHFGDGFDDLVPDVDGNGKP
jgi:hypothetical protein